MLKKLGASAGFGKISRSELISVLKFLIIAFVILPLLPNQNYGLYGFFNPYVIWLMVVFVSGISLLSYVAVRILGTKKGICLTGFLAGLVSSTALTLSFASQSKERRKIVNPYVVAIIIASSAMFFRVIVEILVVNPMLLSRLILPFIVMGFIGIVSAVYFLFKKGGNATKQMDQEVKKLKNPFQLIPALKFGLFFAVILLLLGYTREVLGDTGVYLTSSISGIMDVDVITLSLARMAEKGQISPILAVEGIVIASMVNTFVKGLMFFAFGARKVALKILFVFLLMLIGGGFTVFFL